MDLATIIGIVGGFVLTVMSILTSGGSLSSYINIPSVLMTIGGSLSAVITSNPLSRTLSLGKYISQAIKVKDWGEEKIISTLVAFSEKARREGLLALEDEVEELQEEFLKKGIQLVVDGTDPEIIKNLLYNELNQIQARHSSVIKIFDDWGKFAPAFGMIGTLTGLIAMLANLQDESMIGSGMAVALITTMYGSMMANIMLIPLKSKLEDRDKEETLVREIMIEGILSIQSGDNPRILEQKLGSFLPPSRRSAVMQETANE